MGSFPALVRGPTGVRAAVPRVAIAVVFTVGPAVVPAGAAPARTDPMPAATAAATTPPGTVPPTVAADPDPTTPSVAPAVPAIPDGPHGELSALTPAQTLAAEAEYATLTDTERTLLRRLQTAKERLAVRRFALVALVREVAQAQSQLDEARAVERQARARADETRAQLDRTKDAIVDLAAVAYRNHTDSWGLGSLGAVDMGNAHTLTRATTYARSNAVFLGAQVDILAALERRLEAERRTAETARLAAEAGAADLDARLTAQREAYDAEADAAARAHAAAIRGLRSDVGLVARMIDPQFGADTVGGVLGFVQAGQSEPPTLDAIFALPIPGASLTSTFGLRIDPIGGSVAFHAGLDFAADARTPITAARAGMVVVSGDCGDYGNCVVIDHGTSLATLYGHQSQVSVRVGDTVAAGDVIGLVGSTGMSTGPHLHFEVRLHGAPVDPVPTLAG